MGYLLEPIIRYIDWYWIVIIPTSIAAIITFSLDIRKQQSDISYHAIFLIATTIVSSGFLGGKAASFLEIYLTSGITPSLEVLGTRLYGSILGGLLSCIIIAKLFQVLEILKILDTLAIIGSISFAIGKIGCFLSGHAGCYGIETNLPWGVEFAHGGVSIGYHAHPIQLYDSVFLTILYLFLLRLSHKTQSDGTIFFIFLLLFSGYSITIEFIRDNQIVFSYFTLAQLVYIVIFTSSLTILLNRYFLSSKGN